jgi:hypothetical protein
MKERVLTHKQQLVVETFENLRPGYGKLARQNILSNALGWAAIIESMSEDEITLKTLVQGATTNG